MTGRACRNHNCCSVCVYTVELYSWRGHPSTAHRLTFLGNHCMYYGRRLWQATYPPYLRIISVLFFFQIFMTFQNRTFPLPLFYRISNILHDGGGGGSGCYFFGDLPNIKNIVIWNLSQHWTIRGCKFQKRYSYSFHLILAKLWFT